MVPGSDELRMGLESHGIDWLHIRQADGLAVAVIGPSSMDAVEELIGNGCLEGLFVCMDPDGTWRGARRDRDGSVTLVGGVSERIAYRSILGGYRVGTSHRTSKYGTLNPGDGNHRYSQRTGFRLLILRYVLFFEKKIRFPYIVICFCYFSAISVVYCYSVCNTVLYSCM